VAPVTGFLGFLFFLVFVEEYQVNYAEYLPTPFAWVREYIMAPTPVVLRPYDLIMIVALVVGLGKKEKKGEGFVAPMQSTLFGLLAVTLVAFGYGLMKGGDFRFAAWQIYLIFSMVLTTFAVAANFRTAADFAGLARWLIGAAGYRAFMCWLSYFTWGRTVIGDSGAFMTTHDDTISWVVSILILLVNAIDKRSTKVSLRNLAGIAFFVGALQWNSRRLAWVSLIMGLVTAYSLLPEGVALRRVKKVLRVVLPIVALYVVVGWGRQNIIFLPLRSLSTISTQEDASTLARNAENLGLIATANSGSYALGTGWGRPYIFLTMKYDISGAFELWRFVPHNSILGVLAFTGVLGAIGFWIPLATAVFLNARVARLASDPRARSVGIIGAAQMIVCCNQLYGDMGIFFTRPMYVVAVSYAIALRLPRVAGVWKTTPARIDARAAQG
jgi:hypothetical protein